MDIYKDFASVYDLFMEDVPYDEWTERIRATLSEQGIEDGLVAELGCGTGAITGRMAHLGYDMIGIDASEEMLAVAMDRSSAEDGILYLCQDMTEFELYGTVRAVISVCDTVNYLTDEDDLLKTFKLVNNYLDPGGIFIFDFNTVHKYRDVIGETTIAENRDECSFIWENFYDEDTRINEYDLTLFLKDGDVYRKSTETHRQRGYDLKDMQRLIKEAGLIPLSFTDADTGGAVTEDSERIYCTAKESGK